MEKLEIIKNIHEYILETLSKVARKFSNDKLILQGIWSDSISLDNLLFDQCIPVKYLVAFSDKKIEKIYKYELFVKYKIDDKLIKVTILDTYVRSTLNKEVYDAQSLQKLKESLRRRINKSLRRFIEDIQLKEKARKDLEEEITKKFVEFIKDKIGTVPPFSVKLISDNVAEFTVDLKNFKLKVRVEYYSLSDHMRFSQVSVEPYMNDEPVKELYAQLLLPDLISDLFNS